MSMTAQEIEALAGRLLAAHDAGAATDPIAVSGATLSVPDAYRVLAHNLQKRIARGEAPVGWKIGFTNRTIWDEYDVHAPIWGPMYDTTVKAHDGGARAVDWRISHLHEPRIEPEIAFRMAGAPQAGMTEADLLGCIDAVAHGFEIVQSPYKAWRFQPVDTIAAGSLHGNFVHGPWTAIGAADRAEWLGKLSAFSLTLRRNGEIVDRGDAGNVLDGPLSALRHFIDGLAQQPCGHGILPGDIVTTGTVTRAFPIAAGEQWSSAIDGLPIAGLTIACV